MATLASPLPAVAFAAEVDTLNIATTKPVRVRVDVGRTRALDTTLHPDGHVTTLHGVAQLIQDTEGGKAEHLQIQLDDDPPTGCDIIPFQGVAEQSAAAFVEAAFLTAINAVKHTFATADETLCFYGQGTPTLTAYWATPSGISTTQTTPRTWEVDGATALDASPRSITAPSPDARLVAYRITCGRRRMSYQLLPDTVAVAQPTSFAFLNGFGQIETAHFLGVAELEWKSTYRSAIVDGEFRNLPAKAYEEGKVQTLIFAEEWQLIQDLAQSTEVKVGGQFVEITDAKYILGSSPHDLGFAQLSYRRRKDGLVLKPRRNWRIFDQSFEHSFE